MQRLLIEESLRSATHGAFMIIAIMRVIPSKPAGSRPGRDNRFIPRVPAMDPLGSMDAVVFAVSLAVFRGVVVSSSSCRVSCVVCSGVHMHETWS